MKIKSIKAASFGKLSDKEIIPGEGITVITGDNESGKSSVARFIRFMLYGFTGKKADLSQNDKKKYMPWDGEDISGEMVVETSVGKEYELRRKQGTKAQGSVIDTDTGEPADCSNAGEFLFALPSETYDKTALISAGDVTFDDGAALSAAIKNLVFSADSDIDSDTALKKLEKLKKDILGKTERSGRLYEARLEAAELTERKNILSARHKDLMVAESALLKTKELMKRDGEALEKIMAEYENMKAKAARETCGKIAAAEAEANAAKEIYESKSLYMAFNGFVPDREYLTELNAVLNAYRNSENDLDSAKRELEISQNGVADAFGDEERPKFTAKVKSTGKTASELLGTIRTLEKDAKNKKRLAVILLFFVITIPVSVFLFSKAKKQKAELARLAEELLCKDVEELKARLLEFDDINAAVEKAQMRLDIARNAFEAAQSAKETIYIKLTGLLEKSGCEINHDDASNIRERSDAHIVKLGGDISEREELYNRYAGKKAKLDGLTSAIPDIDELKAKAESYDESVPLREKIVVERELDFYKRKLDALAVREREFEKTAAVIAGNMEKPDELTAKIEELNEEIAVLEKKNAALEIAVGAINTAHETMKGNVSPILTKKASELFNKMTGGKYEGLYVDNDLTLKVLESGSAEYKEVEYLSSGALDAAYLCLRITLVGHLYEEKPVLIFDDAFARFDDTRLERVCEMLCSLSEEYQIIVLSCQKREEAFLKDSAKIIKI